MIPPVDGADGNQNVSIQSPVGSETPQRPGSVDQWISGSVDQIGERERRGGRMIIPPVDGVGTGQTRRQSMEFQESKVIDECQPHNDRTGSHIHFLNFLFVPFSGPAEYIWQC